MPWGEESTSKRGPSLLRGRSWMGDGGQPTAKLPSTGINQKERVQTLSLEQAGR